MILTVQLLIFAAVVLTLGRWLLWDNDRPAASADLADRRVGRAQLPASALPASVHQDAAAALPADTHDEKIVREGAIPTHVRRVSAHVPQG